MLLQVDISAALQLVIFLMTSSPLFFLIIFMRVAHFGMFLPQFLHMAPLKGRTQNML